MTTISRLAATVAARLILGDLYIAEHTVGRIVDAGRWPDINMPTFERELDTWRANTETRVLDRIQHTADLEALKGLKPREREALYLKGLGYRYHEIARLSGGHACRGRFGAGPDRWRHVVNMPSRAGPF